MSEGEQDHGSPVIRAGGSPAENAGELPLAVVTHSGRDTQRLRVTAHMPRNPFAVFGGLGVGRGAVLEFRLGFSVTVRAWMTHDFADDHRRPLPLRRLDDAQELACS